MKITSLTLRIFMIVKKAKARAARRARIEVKHFYEKEIALSDKKHLDAIKQITKAFEIASNRKLKEARREWRGEKAALLNRIKILEKIIKENQEAYQTYREHEATFGQLIFDFACDSRSVLMRQAEIFKILEAYNDKFEAYYRSIDKLDPKVRNRLFLGVDVSQQRLADLDGKQQHKVASNVHLLRKIDRKEFDNE